MSEVPKIVYERLKAAAPVGNHPEADVLTAFGEQALSPGERERVLAHLAACTDCREALALALPATIDVVVAHPEPVDVIAPASERRHKWFALPALRWAAVVAGVVIVASLLTIGPNPWKQKKTMIGSTPPEKALLDQYAAEPKVAEVVSTPDKEAATPQKNDIAKNEVAQHARAPLPKRFDELPSKLQTSKRDLAKDKAAPMAPQAARDELKTRSLEEFAVASKKAGVVGGVVAAPPAASETVEVTGASPMVQTESVPASAGVASRMHVPKAGAIVRAKPAANASEKDEQRESGNVPLALARQETSGESTNYARPQISNARSQWKLANGVLQRTLDAGTNWQTVLRADRPLLCHAARENDIWAGGEAGTLYYSADGGSTWTQVHPAVNGQALSDDVIQIELHKPGQAIVTTRTGQSWTTMDNGKNWERK